MTDTLKRAVLDAIARVESGGRTNVRYTPQGGAPYDPNIRQHPRQYAPGPAGPSSAAGPWQFVAKTWDRMGQPDFSLKSQANAALSLAEQDYARKTGSNLWQDIQTRGPQAVLPVLGSTWAGLKDNPNAAVKQFQATMQGNPLQYSQVGPGGQKMVLPEEAGLPAPGPKGPDVGPYAFGAWRNVSAPGATGDVALDTEMSMASPVGPFGFGSATKTSLPPAANQPLPTPDVGPYSFGVGAKTLPDGAGAPNPVPGANPMTAGLGALATGLAALGGLGKQAAPGVIVPSAQLHAGPQYTANMGRVGTSMLGIGRSSVPLSFT
jgi:muramidase (phage lysozyme)